MLQKVENLLKKFWKVIIGGFLMALITLLVIHLLDSQKEFSEFKNSKTTNYFWIGDTYKNDQTFEEFFILKNSDLINNIRSLSFNNKVERIEICAINGDNLNKTFNYMITSNKKGVIKNILLTKNRIIIDLQPNTGIVQIKIGFKNKVNLDTIRIENQLLINIFNSHNAD